MKKKDFLPVILGADENAYACARLFFESFGVTSKVLCSVPLCATSYSKILSRKVIPDFDRPEVFEKELIKLLSDFKKSNQKLLLISCADYYSELVIKNAPKIENFIENPIISEETYSRFSDKPAFCKLSKELNFSHPQTLFGTPSELKNHTLPFKFPAVIKPANSNSFDYLHADIQGKQKVYFCKDRKDYESVISNLSNSGWEKDIVVQKFISGGTESMFTVNAYCDRNSKVRLIGAAQIAAAYISPDSLGNYLALKTVKNRYLCEKCTEILERLGYQGFANFDIKKDPESGEFVFLELNPRQGRSSYYIRTAGENLMKSMVDDVIYNIPYTQIKYAEKNGVFSALPKHCISKSLDPELLKEENFDFHLAFKRDISPLRSLAIAKRNLAVSRSNLR